MRRRALAAIVAAASGAVPVPGRAQRPTVIARAVLDPAEERAELAGDAKQRFLSITLAARGRAIEVKHVTVVFGNSHRFDVPLRTVIPAGGTSRSIDLPGGDRTVRRVYLRYAIAPGAAAEIVVLGAPG